MSNYAGSYGSSPFGDAVTRNLLAHAERQITDELSKAFGIGRPHAAYNSTLTNAQQSAALSRARLQHQQAAMQSQLSGLVDGAMKQVRKPAKWYSRVREGIDQLLLGITGSVLPMPELSELHESLGVVCRVDEQELQRLNNAMSRALSFKELTFYDRQLLEALKEYVTDHEAETIDFTIGNVKTEGDRIILDVMVQPRRPVSRIDMHINVTPEKIDTVDECGDVMPAKVARRVGERALQQVMSRIRVEADASDTLRTATRTVMNAASPQDYKAQFLNQYMGP